MLTHTKSPSGRTHRLTYTNRTAAPAREVTLRYVEAPRFDDQVQGDLFRKFRAEHFAITVGILPVHVDPALIDRGARPQSTDYLRGYLSALEHARTKPGNIDMLIQATQAQIAAQEA